MTSRDPERAVLTGDGGPGSREWHGDTQLLEGTPESVSLEPEQLATPTQTTEKRKRRGGVLREIAETALIALVIFVAVRSLVLNFRVDGESMFPRLHGGDMLLVNRNAYESFDLYTLVDWLPGVEHADAKEFSPFDDPQRGDIIVFDPPESVSTTKPYIKRIIGLPGETVEVRDGSVHSSMVRS